MRPLLRVPLAGLSVRGPTTWFNILFAQIAELRPVGAHDVDRYI